MASSYLDMTLEHIGPGASEEDLQAFKEACEAVLPAFGDVVEATDFVWNNGRIQFDADRCAYCGRPLPDGTLVPAEWEEDMWEELAPQHESDCAWVTTRAFRR